MSCLSTRTYDVNIQLSLEFPRFDSECGVARDYKYGYILHQVKLLISLSCGDHVVYTEQRMRIQYKKRKYKRYTYRS